MTEILDQFGNVLDTPQRYEFRLSISSLHGRLPFDVTAGAIAAEDDDFKDLPKLLKAWIAFVDNRRDISARATHASHRAVDRYESELLATVGDQSNWGPARLIATTMQERGIDFQNADAVQAFMDEMNAGGGIDTLSAQPEPDGTTSLAHGRSPSAPLAIWQHEVVSLFSYRRSRPVECGTTS